MDVFFCAFLVSAEAGETVLGKWWQGRVSLVTTGGGLFKCSHTRAAGHQLAATVYLSRQPPQLALYYRQASDANERAACCPAKVARLDMTLLRFSSTFRNQQLISPRRQ